MILHNAIQDANRRGNLGLILYIVPNFPTPNIYQDVLSFLESHESVSILESTYPTATGFSPHANQTIRRAHLTAREYSGQELRIRTRKPTLLVLYRGTLEDTDFESFLRTHKEDFEGLILEWSEPAERTYVDAANRQGVELVQCIGPWMSQREMDTILGRCLDHPLIYLMSASMTGAELFSNHELDRCIRAAKRLQPAAKIAAGFGIRSAADVAKLSQVDGLDAVILGTEFLRQAELGVTAVQHKLDELQPALTWK